MRIELKKRVGTRGVYTGDYIKYKMLKRPRGVSMSRGKRGYVVYKEMPFALISSVKDNHGHAVAGHVWVPNLAPASELDKLPMKTKIVFEASVTSYLKGFVGKNKKDYTSMVDARRFKDHKRSRLDFGLQDATLLKVIAD